MGASNPIKDGALSGIATGLTHSSAFFYSSEESLKNFIYLKYWKPIGVTCTTSPQDPMNVIDQGPFRQFPQRIFPVGRLDKDSSGSADSLRASSPPPQVFYFSPLTLVSIKLSSALMLTSTKSTR
jgi:hypothetical protein